MLLKGEAMKVKEKGPKLASSTEIGVRKFNNIDHVQPVQVSYRSPSVTVRDDRLAWEGAPMDLMAPLKVHSIIYFLLKAFELTHHN
jgi:hypothetical protein